MRTLIKNIIDIRNAVTMRTTAFACTRRFLRVYTTAVVFVVLVSLLSPQLLFLGQTKSANAAFNKEINYQGKLTNSSNVAVADGTYHMRFKLYTVATGGASIWDEDRSTAAGDRITLTNGLFSVMLGSSTPLTSVDFNQTLYLGVEVGGSGGGAVWDGEMTPRKKLGAVPAAFVADTLDGLSSEQFLRADATNATNTASTFLTITQNGAGDIANFIGPSSASVLTLKSGGNVGIGTTSPYAKLSVVGQTVSAYFTATTSTASTFPYASTTAITVTGTASTTALNISGISGCSGSNALTTNASGVVACGAIVGGGGAFPFTPLTNYGVNTSATTTALWAQSGIFASSTSYFANAIFDNSTTTNATTTALSVSGTAYFPGSGIWTSTGSVGIGTTSPYAKLSVAGQVVGETFVGTSTATSSFNGSIGIGTSTPGASSGSSSRLTIDGGGLGLAGLNISNLGAAAVYGINLAASAISGATDYFMFNNTNDYWRADGVVNASTQFWIAGTARINTTQTLGIAGAGNAATPGLSFSGDTNTGVFSPSADVVGFSTGGNEYLRVTSTGNIGVSSTTPWAKLSVSSNGGTQPQFVIASSTAGVFATTTDFIVDVIGNVGVGTSSPFAKFSVKGNDQSSGISASTVFSVLGGTGGSGATAGVGGKMLLFAGTGGTGTGAGGAGGAGGAITITTGTGGAGGSGGPAGVGGDLTLTAGNGGAGSGGPDTGGAGGSVYITAGTSGANASAGANGKIVLNGGNVGVGTTSPYAKLSVVGETVSAYFTATTSTASVFPYASTTAITVSGTASTTALNISGISGCSGSSALTTNASGVVACGAIVGGGGAFPFTPLTNYGVNTSATTTALWAQSGIFASSTSQFVAANFSATSTFATGLYIGTTSAKAKLAIVGSTITGFGNNEPGLKLLTVATSSDRDVLAVYNQYVQIGSYQRFTTSNSDLNPSGLPQLLVAGDISFPGIASIATRRIFIGQSASDVAGSHLLLAAGAAGNEDVGGSTSGGNIYIRGGASSGGVPAYDGNVIIADTGGRVGVGTSTPWAKLSVSSHNSLIPQFVVASSSTGIATSTQFIVDIFGNVGVATATPSTKFAVQGAGYISSTLFVGGTITSTSSSASTFPYASTTAITVTGTASTTALNISGISGCSGSNALTTNASGVVACGAIVGGGGAFPFTPLTNYGVNTSATTTALWAQSGIFASSTSYFANAIFDNSTTTNATTTALSVSGTAYFPGSGIWNSSGFIGVGTLSPNARLEVNGDLYFTSAATNRTIGFDTAGGGRLSILGADTVTTQGGDVFIGAGSDTEAQASGGSVFIYAGQGNANGNVVLGHNSVSAFGNVGVATSTPGKLFSVHGAGYISSTLFVGGAITSTSSSASTFPYASTTAITVSGTASTTALNISGISGCSGSSALTTDSSGVVTCGAITASGGAFPFTPLTNYGVNTSATTTALWAKAGIYASSTSYLSQTIIGSGSLFPGAMLNIGSSTDGYLQANIQNSSSGSAASSDWIATNDLGSDTKYYVDLGINSSTYNQAAFSITGANDAYLYSSDSNLAIGTASTTGNANIIFHTAGTLSSNERMRITSTGLVGIGTTTPYAKLSITSVNASSQIPLFAIASSSVSNATSTYFLVNNIGNVGIGTSSPVQKLDVAGNLVAGFSNAGAGRGVLLGNIVGDTTYPGIWFGANTVAPDTNSYSFLWDAGEGTIFNTPSGKSMGFRVNNATKATLSSVGNFGIGTTSAYAKLSVVGGGTDSILPSFIVATTSDWNNGGQQPLFYVTSTTTGLLDYARVAIGTTTTWGAGGLRDQLTVAGRVYTTWRYLSCDVGGSGGGAWSSDAAGACGDFAFDLDTDGTAILTRNTYPPAIQLQAGATNPTVGDGSALRTAVFTSSATSSPIFEAWVQATRTATATTTPLYVVGLTDAAFGADTGTVPTQGAFFTATSGPNWIMVTKNRSGETFTNTNVATSTTNFLKMRIELSTTSATYLINGAVVAVHNTTIPSATLQPITLVANFAGASVTANANPSLLVSLIRFWMDDPPGSLSTPMIAQSEEVGGVASLSEDDIKNYNSVSAAAITAPYLVGDPTQFVEGSVVAFHEKDTSRVRLSNKIYDANVFGVVGMTSVQNLGETNEHTVNVAMSGRVPVLISLENGDIKPGDYLTSSSISGVAMKATASGPVIGRAIQSYDENSKLYTKTVMMKVEPTYYYGNMLVQDTFGNVGIGTTSPSFKLTVSGDVAGYGFSVFGDRNKLDSVTSLTETDLDTYLDKIKGTTISTYRYKNEDESAPLRLGIVADEAPSEILSVGGKDIDAYKLAVFTLGGVKALQHKFDNLEMRVTALENQLGVASTTATSSATSTGIVNSESLIVAIMNYLKNFGVNIAQDVAQFKNVIVETFTVGSSEKPTGITLYDEVTGEPYCLKMSNGKMLSVAGECGQNNNVEVPTSEVQPPQTQAQTGGDEISGDASADADVNPPNDSSSVDQVQPEGESAPENSSPVEPEI